VVNGVLSFRPARRILLRAILQHIEFLEEGIERLSSEIEALRPLFRS